MQISLRLEPAAQFQTRTYDPDLDDVRSILMDVCDALESGSEFALSGFGQDVWPVDVRTDLAVFLEQMPNALCAIKERKPAEIDFYEQGVERSIAFEPDGTKYLATCKTWSTTWQPHPSIEEISADSLEQMLLAARDEFMRALTMMAPSLANHSWIREWLRVGAA
jgi:hypothetical protein